MLYMKADDLLFFQASTGEKQDNDPPIAYSRYMMTSSNETFSALLASCEGNPPVSDGYLHKGPPRGALMSSLIYTWINVWVNNRDTGDLRHHGDYYDVIVVIQCYASLHLHPHQIFKSRRTNVHVCIWYTLAIIYSKAGWLCMRINMQCKIIHPSVISKTPIVLHVFMLFYTLLCSWTCIGMWSDMKWWYPVSKCHLIQIWVSCVSLSSNINGVHFKHANGIPNFL